MRLFIYISLLSILLPLDLLFAQHSSTPVNMGASINSEYEELSPVISGDGSKLYFVRMNHPQNKYGSKKSQDIWFSEKGPNNQWSQAIRLPEAVNITRYNSIVWTNQSGTEIVIQGIFNRKGTEWKQRGLSKLTYQNGNWSAPKPLKIKGMKKLNEGQLNAAFLSENEQVLLLSFSSVIHSKKSDLYISLKNNDKYTRPKKIKPLNSKYDEQAPSLSVDHKTIYYSSNMGGNYNIYQSEKLDNSWKNWSEPKPLNKGVNSSGWESYFRMIMEDKSALFVSTDNSLGNADIFKIDFEDIPEEVQPEADEELLTLTGIIADENGAKIPHTNFIFYYDSLEADYILRSPDSAYFEVNVPYREAYHFTASLAGFRVDTVTFYAQNKGLNLYDIRLTANKKEQPAPHTPTVQNFRLRGSLLENDTRQPLPVDIVPYIGLENALVDSSYYNAISGNYFISFTLSDANPILSVSATGYRDFTKVIYASDAAEINQDILLHKKATGVMVYGKILNANTNSPLATFQGLSLKVNEVVSANFAYIQEDNSYQVVLEKGKTYTLVPQLKGFFGAEAQVDLTNTQVEKWEKDLFLTPLEVGQAVKLEKIFFKTGSFELMQESTVELRKIATFLRENPNIVVEIAGHTDNTGNDASNLKLSEERAKSVARYIILSGIPRERIEFKGYGETQPIATNDTAQGREQNRRVEFRVLKN